MARHRKHEEHVNHEAWAIPYGDLITLLLAFFVVMYAISAVNEGKYRVLSDSLVAAFRAPPRAMEPIQSGQVSRTQTTALIERPSLVDRPMTVMSRPGEKADQGRSEFPMVGDVTGGRVEGHIDEIAEEIRQALEGLMEQGLVSVRATDLWLEIEIKDSVLFPSGSARLQADAIPVLRKVADILGDFPNPVRVEGFTDTVPINTFQYPSNWELSGARAASVVRLFGREGIAPQRMSALGYGEFRPIADNNTPEGRAQNRRVVLVVLADEQIAHLLSGNTRDRIGARAPVMDDAVPAPVELDDMSPPERLEPAPDDIPVRAAPSDADDQAGQAVPPVPETGAAAPPASAVPTHSPLPPVSPLSSEGAGLRPGASDSPPRTAEPGSGSVDRPSPGPFPSSPRLPASPLPGMTPGISIAPAGPLVSPIRLPPGGVQVPQPQGPDRD